VSRHLRRLVPFSVSVLYQYDDLTDELIARHSTGDVAGLTTGLRVPLGQRLSGWVGANRTAILNSDPSLDFGEVARTFNPHLRSSLSSPLAFGDRLLGVLTLYSTQNDGFTEDHRRIVEQVVCQMVEALKHVGESEHRTFNATLPGEQDPRAKLH
jgi:GAF domain-containing protein